MCVCVYVYAVVMCNTYIFTQCKQTLASISTVLQLSMAMPTSLKNELNGLMGLHVWAALDIIQHTRGVVPEWRSLHTIAAIPPVTTPSAPPNTVSLSFSLTADKEADEYYMKRRHLPDLAARGTLPLNVIKMSQTQTNQRERPRRPVRAMSQDRVLSPERVMPEEFSMSYERILSDEQLLSAERLHSQDPLLSPERSGFADQSMSRALSHTDVFVSTPVLDRYRMTKMHSHPSASNNLYNTLCMNQTSAKRQAFASRRHNTVEQLHYIPGHHQHYRTASKTEVTV